MKNKIWYMPEYCRNFKCKIDACRVTCCSNWKIPVSKSEYEKLMNMECSDELYRRVQRTFEEPELISEDRYRYISFNWLGFCPLQEKGLCSIHKEKGEDYLPKICRLYPRSYKRINQYNFLSCSSSCEGVLEYLYDHNEMKIIAQEHDGHPEIKIEISEDEIIEIVDIQKIFQNKERSLVEKIREVCIYVNEEEFTKDFDSPDDPLENAIELLKRLSTSNDRLEAIVDPIVTLYQYNKEQYKKDVTTFEQDYPEWMSFFERVINNSLLYENFPFTDSRIDKTLSYKGLCVCYGLMRIIGVGHHHNHKNKDDLIDALSALFHLIDHTAFYYNVSVIVENAAVMLKL